MTLLFDQNMSPVLVHHLRDVFTSIHVRDLGLSRASDTDVWTHARGNEMIIVSNDADFHQRSLLLGAPPKVIWIRRGNCRTAAMTALRREAADRIFAGSRRCSFWTDGCTSDHHDLHRPIPRHQRAVQRHQSGPAACAQAAR